MKNYLFTISLLIVGLASSQTNTFPTSGNIGIGTNTPSANLEIQSSGAHYSSSPSLLIKDITNRGTMFLESVIDQPTDFVFKNNNRLSWVMSTRGSVDNYALRFFPSQNGTYFVAPTLSMLTNGNVGIGTTTPEQKLHINGSAIFNNESYDHSNIRFGHESNDRIIADNSSDKTYGGGYFFRVHNEAIGHKYVDVMMLSDKGNVGIGTKNPQAKLEVSSGNSGDAILRIEADEDNNNESDNPLIQFRQDGGQLGVNMGFSEENFGGNIFGIGTRYTNQESWNTFTINTQNGNVGIGGANPNHKLHVSGTINATGNLTLDGAYLNVIVPSTGYWARGFFNTASDKTSRLGGVGLFGEGNSPKHYYMAHGTSPWDSGKGLYVKTNGHVGIGTAHPDAKLTVKGKIHTQEVKVDLAGAIAPDYVFLEDYNLKTIEEVAQHILEKGHLPNIPSAKEMEKEGINLKEMNLKLLEKIEELTLYTIQQQKRINELEGLKKEIEEIKRTLRTVPKK